MGQRLQQWALEDGILDPRVNSGLFRVSLSVGRGSRGSEAVWLGLDCMALPERDDFGGGVIDILWKGELWKAVRPFVVLFLGIGIVG